MGGRDDEDEDRHDDNDDYQMQVLLGGRGISARSDSDSGIEAGDNNSCDGKIKQVIIIIIIMTMVMMMMLVLWLRSMAISTAVMER